MQRLFVGGMIVIVGLTSLVFAQPAALEIQADNQYHESPPRYTVALSHDGSLQGWAGFVEQSGGAFQAAPGALVHLIRGGEIVKTLEAGREGYFRIADVVPGVYSVTVIDEDGFSASAFHVVPPGHDAAYSSMLCTLISHADFDAAGKDGDALAGLGAPGDGATAGGQGGGGGGGSGGFGGLLGFGIGAAGLAAGIAALADNGSDGSQTAASPATP